MDCDGIFHYTERRVWTLGYCCPDVIWILSAREHCNWNLVAIAAACDLESKPHSPGIQLDPDAIERVGKLLVMH
jgi:hypothetical protein